MRMMGLLGLAAVGLVGGAVGVLGAQCPAGGGHARGSITSVCAGDDFSCALLGNGSVACFGDGSLGQLGAGRSGTVRWASSAALLEVAASEISCGAAHVCAVRSSGSLHCWGDGSAGQLGGGNVEVVGDDEDWDSGAVSLGSGVDAAQVSAGEEHTCTVTDDGEVFCFGNGAHGRLGYGSEASVGDDELPSAAGAVDLGGRSAEEVAAGYAHTCVRFTTGDVACWGLGWSGQLGNGANSSIGDDEPLDGNLVDVDLGSGRTATAIFAGGNRTCAVLDDGSGVCWGEAGRALGQPAWNENIGDDEAISKVPVLEVAGDKDIASFAMGAEFVCAVLGDDSSVCWGESGTALGQGQRGDVESPAESVTLGIGAPVASITAGTQHACAVTIFDTALCWGKGNGLGRGPLGESGGDGGDTYTGDDDEDGGGGDDEDGGGGNDDEGGKFRRRLFLFLDDDWEGDDDDQGGNDDDGEGDDSASSGEIGDDEAPFEAQETLKIGLDAYVCEWCGEGTVQMDDQDSAEDVVCDRCPLGYIAANTTACEPCPSGSIPSTDGTSCDACSATEIMATPWACEACTGDLAPDAAGLTCICPSGLARDAVTATAHCTGEYHTCVITDIGDVMCWGEGEGGHLGYGVEDVVGDDEDPGDFGTVNLGAGVTATSLSCGGYHTCIITNTNDVMCWGEGSSGQLGYGNTDYIGDDEDPEDAGTVDLGDDVTATSLDCGSYHTCVITNNGDVMCWGYAGEGRLGYGNLDNIGDDERPKVAGIVNITDTATAKSISCGDVNTCIITDMDEVMCWGDSNYGQLGYGNERTIGNNDVPADAGIVNVTITAGESISSVEVGGGFICAITSNGHVKCWGRNYEGQLGRGNSRLIGDDEEPAQVTNINLGDGVTAKSISCGSQHLCIITDSDEVMCWGSGGDGRLGYGNEETIGDDQGEDPQSAGAVNIGDSVSPTAISCGDGHTCIITDSGEIMCWGEGDDGRLGYGNTRDIGDDEDPAEAGAVNLGFHDTCDQCPAGTFPNTTSVPHTCITCSGASISSVGDATCTPCAADEAAIDNVCTACGDGEVPSADGKSCVECAAGEYESAAGVCSTCDTGSVSDAGASSCTACDGVGEYAVDVDACGMCSGDLEPTDDGTDCACPDGEGREETKAIDQCSGGYHTCVITDTGDVMCWGDGFSGQLGNGEERYVGRKNEPVDAGKVNIGENTTATQIACGSYHTCIITDAGKVMCWGENDDGRLGYGNTVRIGDDEEPEEAGTVKIGARFTATSISCGDRHTCIITNTSQVMCWGEGDDGQLGYGDTYNIGDDENPEDAGTVWLGFTVAATQVACGSSHTCIVTNTSEVMCWGNSDYGQLGYGNIDYIGDNENPAKAGIVNLGKGVNATTIDCGDVHTCIITNFDEVMCWGKGNNGQLGYGNQDFIGDDEDPKDAGTVNIGDGVTATSLSCGYEHTCIITNSDKVMCWGDGGYGQLGYGNEDTIGDDEEPEDAGVVKVSPFVPISISCGEEHTCIVTSHDSVMCWGEADSGQLGYGNERDIGENEDPIDAGTVNLGVTNTTCEQCSAGTYPNTTSIPHLCVVCPGGSISAAGDATCTSCAADEVAIENVCTACGDGEVPDSDGTSCVECAAGEYESAPGVCSMCDAGSVSDAGATSCTACDGSGEYAMDVDTCGTCAGDLEQNDDRTDCACPDGEARNEVTAIDQCAGNAHTCIVTDVGDVICWGDGGSGRLGYGNENSIGDDEDPVDASTVNFGDGVTATSISCGYYHTCIITNANEVMCWGDGEYGQLGYGNTDDVGDDEDPEAAGTVNIGSGVTATQISAGSFHTCIITNADDVMCWGFGNAGRLGYGNSDDIGDDEHPSIAGTVNIGDGVTATSIACGGSHTCIINNDDDVMCWGSASQGQLGYGDENSVGIYDEPVDAGTVNIGDGVTATDVSCGDIHTCIVTNDGGVMCWGDADNGQLGHGDTWEVGSTNVPADIGTVNITEGATATSVSCGELHTCIITDSDEVMCWGYGYQGQLGYGNEDTIGDNEEPRDVGVVNIGDLVTATTIFCGHRHTCIITDSDKVKCWGEGDDGRLGYGDENDVGRYNEPEDVGIVELGVYDTCDQCSAGTYPNTTSIPHLCVKCEQGYVSSVGDATCTPCAADEAAIENVCTACGDGEVPDSDGTSCVECAAGEYESAPGVCSMCAAGSVSDAGATSCTACDGSGEYAMDVDTCGTCTGELEPNDDRTDCACPSGKAREEITAIDHCTGYDHTCVIIDTGDVICWGDGDSGVLGYGNEDDIGGDEDPADIGTVNIGDGVTATSISCGYYHTCIITDTNEVMCWGRGYEGQLGYGNPDHVGDDEDPEAAGTVNIGSGVTATQVSCGYYHTCIITNNDDVLCWGEGDDGQLGFNDDEGDDDGINEPADNDVVNIGDGVTATSITCGSFHTCIITDADDVMCWGDGYYGQLGYNNTDDIGLNEDPADVGAVNIGDGVTATQITAGDRHTCIITDADKVMCWGDGEYGRLGYGNEDDIGDDEDPEAAGSVKLGQGVTATQITAGFYHTCIITNADDVMCWGDSGLGRLGYGNEDDIGDDEHPKKAGVVNIGLGVTATSISSNQDHTCILTDTSALKCWGDGQYGKLGYGDYETVGRDDEPGDVGTANLGVTADTCMQCPTGTYPNTTSIPYRCIACEFGTTSEPGDATCSPCSGTNFYSRVSQSCIKCYDHSTPTTENMGCIFPTCAFGEVADVSGDCVSCATSEIVVDVTTCEACGVDEMAHYSTQTCISCGDGEVPNSAGNACEECAAGTYESTPGTCSQCATGFVSSAGATSCSECSGADEIADSSQETCETCGNGFISSSDNSECEACPIGTYESSSGTCSQCATGSVATAGSASCTECSDSDEAADSAQETCESCGSGYVSSSDNSECEACPAGSYESSSGTCSQCATGFVATAGSSSCTECSDANEAADSEQETCETCGNGFISSSDNSECEACPAGEVESSPGTCTPCDGRDEYAKKPGKCGKCPAGEIPSSDRSTCDLCPGGSYEDSRGNCEGVCEDDAYSYAPAGSYECSVCSFMKIATEDRSDCEAPCNSVDCSPKGICYLDIDGLPVCACTTGYEPTQDGDACQEAEDVDKKSCNNGRQGGIETDVDCGGGICNACPVGFHCDTSASCQDGLVCVRDASSPAGGTCSPLLLKRGIPLYVDRVELQGLGAAQVRLAAARLIAEAFLRGITDLTQAVVDAVDMDQVADDVNNGRRLQAVPTAYLNFTLTFNATHSPSTATAILNDFLDDPHGNNTSPLAMEVKKIATDAAMDPDGLIVIGTKKVGVQPLPEITSDKQVDDPIEYDDIECDGKDEYKGSTSCQECGDGKVPNDDNDGCDKCARGEETRGTCRSLYAPPSTLEAGIIVIIVLAVVCAAGFIYALCHRHRRTVQERRDRLGLSKPSPAASSRASGKDTPVEQNPMHGGRV